jgi:hypothetical protein
MPTGWWNVYPRAANNGTALTDASIDGDGVWCEQDPSNPGLWYVSSTIGTEFTFSVYCDNYQTAFVYTYYVDSAGVVQDLSSPIYVDMAYIGSWPQTY